MNPSATSLNCQKRRYLIASRPARIIRGMTKKAAAPASKKGKITAEHLEEARRLHAIWDETKPARAASGVGTQEAFGARYGIGNQAAVGFFLNGKTALSLKAASAFAQGLGCAVSDFSPRLARLLFEQTRPDASGLSNEALRFAQLFEQLPPVEREKFVKIVDALQTTTAPPV